MTARPTAPYHCPFCAEQDLRPDESDRHAWVCRSCARVFVVSLVRVDRSLVPAHVAHEAHP